MKKAVGIIFSLLLAAAIGIPSPSTASPVPTSGSGSGGQALGLAQGEISVINSSHVNKFPDGLEFVLEASAASSIRNITLAYTINTGDNPSSGYDRPEFEPGTRVSAKHMLEKRKTYMPPGTTVTYHWVIEDESGSKLETQPVTATYDDIRFNWKSISREGVTLYWYDWHAQSPDIARQALDEAISSIQRLSKEVGITYSRPMRIYGYASKRDMDPALQPRSRIYDQQSITLGQRTTAEVMLLLLNHIDYKETVAHEVSHMVIHQAAEGPYTRLPAWLDEGLAMNAELVVPHSYISEFEAAARRDQLLSIRSMDGPVGDPALINIFYGQTRSVVRFLLDNYGREKMIELLQAFKEGTLVNDALKEVYGFDVEGLDAKWRASLGLKPRVIPQGGGGPTVLEIPTIAPLGSESTSPSSTGAKSSQRDGSREGGPQTNSPAPILLFGIGGALVLALAGGVVFLMRRGSA